MTEANELQPYVIPETWTPEHVAVRLIEAFAIDRRLPRIERPKSTGSTYSVSKITAEEMAQWGITAEEMAKWEQSEIDPKRFPPLPADIRVMERAFDWLPFVYESRPSMHFALKIWAIAKAGGRSAKGFCNNNGLPWATFRSRKDAALSLIASRLNEVNEPVW